MTLEPGHRLGPHEVLRALGSGGMGEVYEARDTRLGRTVAIKVLPESFAEHPERLARFEREARAISQLNHPNVCALFDVGDQDGLHFLVLEHLDGTTLAERLKRGPLPLADTLRYGAEIAEALAAAHGQGVVHRDLKPANVMLTPSGVKLLDFGLARVAGGSHEPADLPTFPMHEPDVLTTEGTVLGTFPYMSPEQVEGREVDARSDLFALGALLYEMASGHRAFPGESAASVMAAILRAEPEPLASLSPLTPPALEHVVSRCLAKDRAQRWQSATDIAAELRWIAGAGSQVGVAAPSGSKGARSGVPLRLLATSALALAALVLAAIVWFRPSAAPQSPLRPRTFGLSGWHMPSDVFSSLAVSPDGERVVMRVLGADRQPRLFVRDTNSLELRTVEDSAGGWLPFLHPEGREFVFFRGGRLHIASTEGGPPREIAEPPRGFMGGAWLDDGSIVFTGEIGDEVYRMASPDDAVQSHAVTGLGDSVRMATPSALPGRRSVLVGLARSTQFDVGLLSLDDYSVRVLARSGHQPIYSATGHVLYQDSGDGQLMALPFDLADQRVTGQPIGTGTFLPARLGIQQQLFAISRDGMLLYIDPQSSGRGNELTWVGRDGETEFIATLDNRSDLPRLSPSGRRIAFRSSGPNCDIWIHDLERGTTSRLTSEGDNHGSVWSADGRFLYTMRADPVDYAPVKLRADGSGAPVALLDDIRDLRFWATDLVPGTGDLIVAGGVGGDASDVERIVAASRTRQPVFSTRFQERAARVSPNGRIIAYASDESGRFEVYIRSFPSLESRIQVSVEGGGEPVWSGDGRTLFYRFEDRFFAVAVDADGEPRVDTPREVARGNFAGGSSQVAGYDANEDGSRLLVVRLHDADPNRPNVIVTVNWFSELARRIGA